MIHVRIFEIREADHHGKPQGPCLAVVMEAKTHQEALDAFMEDHITDISGIQKLGAFKVMRPVEESKKEES